MGTPANYFDEPVASRYDADYAALADPTVLDPAVELLAALAGAGAALELGVGTGRVALPLHARGVPVHGIDLSGAMLARLREKPGGDAIALTEGDFATTRVDGTFTLAFIVRNTLWNLTTQDAQVDCFRNVAAHLEPGGCFVVELFVPRLQFLPVGETFLPFVVTPTHLGIDEYDVVTQALVSHHYRPGTGGAEHRAVPGRYAWPAELDLMARLAGMSLRERWADWDRTPFTSESASHVSVWQKD